MLNALNPLPKISIITPSYNQGQYIEETILSVINQNYPNLEYIIIDGGSTDETVSIIKKYEDKIDYWVSEEDKGQTDAINKGFLKATGEIINWLNSDDYLAEDSLFEIARCFSSKEVNCVSGNVKSFHQSGVNWMDVLPEQKSALSYLTKTYNNQPGTFFRKKIWEPFFPIPTQLHYAMDQYLWFCFWLSASTNELLITKKTLTNFRRHDFSKTIAKSNLKPFKHLSEAFFDDYHSIFVDYLRYKGFGVNTLANYFFEVSNAVTNIFDGRRITTLYNNEKIFHNYLLALCEEDYNCGKMNRMRASIKKINCAYLTEENKVLYFHLRNQPFWFLKNAYRKVYWLFKENR